MEKMISQKLQMYSAEKKQLALHSLLALLLYVWAVSIVWAQSNAPDKVYTLGELYTMALREDVALKAAEKNKEANLLNAPIARADLLPQLTWSYSYTRFLDQTIVGSSFGVDSGSADFDDYGSDSWQLSLRQTLFNMPQILDLKQSHSEAAVAELSYENSKQDLILRLSEIYFAVLSAKNRLDVARSEKEAFAEQRKQAQQNFEIGRTAIVDIRSASAAYDLAVADEIAAKNQLQTRLNKIATVVGMQVRHLMGLGEKISVKTPVPNDVEQWVTKALNNNLEILTQQVRTNIADREINRQRAKHLPSLNLVATRNDSDIRGGPSPREYDDLQLGVELHFELFGGGRTYYQTKQAIEQSSESSYRLEQIKREVEHNTRQYYTQVMTEVLRIRALAEAILSAETALQSNQEGFDAGKRTSSDVLLALRDLYQVQFEYKEAKHSYLLNTLRLKKAVGHLTQEDINQVDRRLVEK